MYIPFSFIILRPDYADSNLHSHILSRFLLGAFSGITVINAAVNMHSGGVLGGVGNNSNTIIIYSFLHAGTRFFKGRIFFYYPCSYRIT